MMRIAFPTFIFTLLVFSCPLAQQINPKWKFFEHYDPSERTKIVDQWHEYFLKDPDIHDSLDDNFDFTSANCQPLYFDNYGHLYPDFKLFENCTDAIYKRTGWSAFRSKRYSMFHVFGVEENRREFSTNNNIYFNGKKQSTYANWLNSQPTKETFYEDWDKFHDKEAAEAIKNKLQASNKTKILFFIHGYNVPQSLAYLQAKNVVDSLCKNDPTLRDSLLVVPVYWSSNDQKKRAIANAEDFNTDNKIALMNGVKFNLFVKRCGYIAIGLRRVLNELEANRALDSVETFVFAHSMGNVIATGSVIKLHPRRQITDYFNPDGTEKKKLQRLDRCRPEQAELMRLQMRVPIPKEPISFFLSAAAIPGVHTFEHLDAKNSDFKFYVTVSPNDEMLRKKMMGPAVRFLTAAFLNARGVTKTTLGCNYLNEIGEVQSRFKDTVLFYSSIVSLETDHDIFSYLDQHRYTKMLEDFFPKTKNLPDTCTSDPCLNQVKLDFQKEYDFLKATATAYEQDRRKVVQPRTTINIVANNLRDEMYLMEKRTTYEQQVSARTRELIAYMQEPYMMVLLERSISDDITHTNEHLRDKLLKEISRQMNLRLGASYAYYSYESHDKKALKFISLSTGNDLFAPGRNYDRDYTGALRLEIATDYLNIMRRRPLKSYQTLSYGFDVFTPYYRIPAIFTSDSTHNPQDRPHGSFEFLGYSKKGLAKFNHVRWEVNVKVGVIGGQIGNKFQQVLHRDISSSLKPLGWGHQIANGKRLGISFETKHEYLFNWKEDFRERNNPGRKRGFFKNLYPSAIGETRIGTYMTGASLGLQLCNKPFRLSNQNYIHHRTRQTVYHWGEHFMWNISFVTNAVVHNTMLEGYGIYKTTEEKQADPEKDPQTYSIHKLAKNQVNRVTHRIQIGASYTTRNWTIFYNWNIFSPETKLGRIDAINDEDKPVTFVLNKRWHQFATIGVTFNLH